MEFKSMVYSHTNNPYFCDGFRISLSDSDMEACHIRLLICNYLSGDKNSQANVDLAFAIINLKTISTGAILPDDTYKLCVYKMEYCDIRKVKEYSRLPFLRQDDESNYSKQKTFNEENVAECCNPKDYVIVQTQLLSSNLTTNKDIKILKNYKNFMQNTDFDSLLNNLLYCTTEQKQRFFYEMVFNVIKIGEETKVTFQKQLHAILHTLSATLSENCSIKSQKFFDGLDRMHAPSLKNNIYTCMIENLSTIDNKTSREIIRLFYKMFFYVIRLMRRSGESAP